MTGRGYPYTKSAVLGFYNHTIVGSRLIIDRFYVAQPAPSDFCNKTFDDPATELNAVPPGVCGVNGQARRGGQYGASTHENDGKSLDMVPIL